MHPRKHPLRNSREILIRESMVEDAHGILDYLEAVSGESDFLTFGPGEFGHTEAEEEAALRQFRDSANQLHILGLMDDTIVSILTFSAGHRPRIQHSGEFSMSVRKQYWGLRIGSFMLDTLIDWARENEIVNKINLRVRTDNQRGIQLYKHKGFVTEGTLRREILLDGTYFDLHCMGLIS